MEKETAVETKPVESWKKMSEMSNGEIKALPLVLCHVSMTKSKFSEIVRYTLTARLFKGTLDIAFPLTQAGFYIIQKEWQQLGRPTFDIRCPFRLVHGITKGLEGGKDREFYHFETYPCGWLYRPGYLSALLKRDQCEEIHCLGYDNNEIITQRGYVEKVVLDPSSWAEDKEEKDN